MNKELKFKDLVQFFDTSGNDLPPSFIQDTLEYLNDQTDKRNFGNSIDIISSTQKLIEIATKVDKNNFLNSYKQNVLSILNLNSSATKEVHQKKNIPKNTLILLFEDFNENEQRRVR